MAGMLSNAAWRTQRLLHSGNVCALPVALLLVASGLVVYRHTMDSPVDESACRSNGQLWDTQCLRYALDEKLSQEEVENVDCDAWVAKIDGLTSEEKEEAESCVLPPPGADSLKTFLALIVLQMLPLVFLETKIASCTDPVSLLARFGPKVLLMHLAFLSLRVFAAAWAEVGLSIHHNVVGLVAGCLALRVGFQFKLSMGSFLEHLDVLLLAFAAAFAGLLTEGISIFSLGFESMLPRVLSTVSDYIEIMAFMPAVWILYSNDKYSAGLRADVVDPRKGSVFLFAFLAVFYAVEDVYVAYSMRNEIPLATMGHGVHYMLLLDFAGFILGHLYCPEKLQQQVLSCLPF